MAKTKDYVNEIMEHVIEKTKIVPYDHNKKVIDFKLGDVVKCNYISGLFLIVSLYPNENRVEIRPIDHNGEAECVVPGCLERQIVDKNTVKVLYD